MTITYQNMKDKKESFDIEFRNRVSLLSRTAKNIMDAYEESLDLPEKTWRAFTGEYKRYVVAYKNENGKYSELKHIDSIDNNNYPFSIGTVLEASDLGGDMAICDMTLIADRNAEEVTVIIHGKNKKEFTVIDGDLTNICNAIKEATYADISKFEKN